MEGWRVETLYSDIAQAFKVKKVLHESATGKQDLAVLDTERLGRVLFLDGVVQTTEADEFVYHEMLTHVPLFAHGAAKRVLVIGGGDGGMLREIVKHKEVEKITLVEIDKGVVDFSKKHLPSLSDGAFDDERVEVAFEDGARYVSRFKRKTFDVIIVDSTDPEGPGAALFTKEFYQNCKERLGKGGILVTQNGVPFLQPDELRDTMTKFSELFEDHSAYLANVPTYYGGPMALGWGSDSARRRQVSEKVLEDRFAAADIKTRYYTPAVHKAAFALPRYIEELMPK
ncbi:MAG: polyamine aminopropyltransferase [Neomegalonema sp.]|nr:polyamine aminopropyltransferase [Neomegalonema sp.]